MHRILIALLAAFDALLTAAVGLGAVLAPLTLVWIFALGLDADWAALWPVAARVWELGNLVPVPVSLDDATAAALGLDADATTFWISLAPLLFAVGAAVSGARSGRRAARSGAALVGVAAGAATTALVAAIVFVTSSGVGPGAHGVLAVLLPSLVYGIAALAGAVAEAWTEGGGPLDAVRGVLDGWSSKWREVPELAVRGTAMTLTALVGAAALVVTIAVVLRADEVVALFERAQVDLLGVIVVALAQMAYLPTLLGWAVAWIAGPGFAVGAATSVSPAGTQLGVVPGIPLLGLLPEHQSPWTMLVLLLPVAAGALAGWHLRTLLVAEWRADPPEPAEFAGEQPREPVSPRLVLALSVAVLSGAGAALIAAVSSGAMGPARLQLVGPAPGQVALAVGLEVLLGAAILLLAPLGRRRTTASAEMTGGDLEASAGHDPAEAPDPDAQETEALDASLHATEPLHRGAAPVKRGGSDGSLD